MTDLENIMKTGSVSERIEALTRFALTQDTENLPYVLGELEHHRSLNVKQAMCLSLRYFDAPGTGFKLEKMLEDDSPKVRWAAAYGLSGITSYTPHDFFRRAAESSDRETWSLALQSLNTTNLPAAEHMIESALSHSDPFVVSTAVYRAGKLTGPDFIERAKGFTGHPDVTVRENAFRILYELGDNGVLEDMANDEDEIIRMRAQLLAKGKIEEKKSYDPELEDKFIGCMVGAAIGDAIGAPIETLSQEGIQKRYGTVTSYISNELRRGTPLGIAEWTDDTEMAMTVAESLMRMGGIDPQHLGELFGRDIDRIDSLQEKERGYSVRSIQVSRMLRLGVNWRYTGIDSLGCGSVMRAHPIGLFFRDNMPDMKKNSDLQSRITHNGEESSASSLLLCYAVSLASQYKPEDGGIPQDFYKRILDLSGCSGTLHDELKDYADNQNLTLLELVELKKGGRGPVGTVTVAVDSFMRSPDDFRDVIIRAINHSGDSDSVGSMAGAMAGAYNGFSRIPEDMVKPLYRKDDLIELGKQLYKAYRKT
ncbi:ADP-ribosylglycohydrolase family protein [Candidatus Woesearchaeota archaeon]|nr:ADP-ribosylglycohydrolase family protein [Candidatus Woesearchaeota archaeon]